MASPRATERPTERSRFRDALGAAERNDRSREADAAANEPAKAEEREPSEHPTTREDVAVGTEQAPMQRDDSAPAEQSAGTVVVETGMKEAVSAQAAAMVAVNVASVPVKAAAAVDGAQQTGAPVGTSIDVLSGTKPAHDTAQRAQPGTAQPAHTTSRDQAPPASPALSPDTREGDGASAAASAARESARGSTVEPKPAARTSAVNARPAQIDPLARLVEGGRELRQSAQPQATAAAQPVAARLAEVEGQIARDRIEQSVARGEVALGGSADDSTPAATASGNSAANPAAAQAAQVQQQALSAGNAGNFGAMLADSAPAPELASPADSEAHPAAQLAAKGVGILSNQRGGAITMRLEPPALGQLRIELQIQQGAVVADFTAATPEARALLEANLGMLRERLESQGLSVERISVHGGRGTESTAAVAAPAGSDARQDGASARSDSGDRGDRGNARQDAAGGESRGRRDGDARAQRDRTDAAREGVSRGFAEALHGETARRTEPMRRAG